MTVEGTIDGSIERPYFNALHTPMYHTCTVYYYEHTHNTLTHNTLTHNTRNTTSTQYSDMYNVNK